MTYKELAKEYEEKKAECIEVNDDGKRRYSSIDIQEAYLAGLKAGKDMNVSIRWHDLRENPNDLPKEWQPVIAVTSYENYLILRFYPKTSIKEQHWRPLDDDILDNDNYFTEIIAWCELPKFEKE